MQKKEVLLLKELMASISMEGLGIIPIELIIVVSILFSIIPIYSPI